MLVEVLGMLVVVVVVVVGVRAVLMVGGLVV